jgi:hypothetical protein
MNAKAIWLLPLALVALPLTSIADAGQSARGPAAVALNAAMQAFNTGEPDLCGILDRYGDPLRCDAVGPGMAPLWDNTVCCNSSSCYAPGTSGCATGTRAFWCENAIVQSTGAVNCVYEVPTYCDEFPCGPGDITAPPMENAICCYPPESGCYDHEGGICGGIEVWCGVGVSNEDGTVTCLDGEDE